MDADGRRIRTHDFRRHIDFSMELPDFPAMQPVSSSRIAPLRRSERDGLLLLHMGMFCESALHAKCPARTDGAVRVLHAAVQRDAASGTNHGGKGGSDRLGRMHVCRLNERQQFDLLPCRLRRRAVVVLCFFVICVDLFVECHKDAAILCIPCRLRRISMGRAGRSHGRDAECGEDRVVIVVVRGERSDEFLGNWSLPDGNFVRRDLFDLLIGGTLIDGLLGDMAVVCPVAAADVPKLPFRERLASFDMSQLVDADLGGVYACIRYAALCRKGGVFVLYVGGCNENAALRLDARTPVLQRLPGGKSDIPAGVEQGVPGILNRIGMDMELIVRGNDSCGSRSKIVLHGIYDILLCIVGSLRLPDPSPIGGENRGKGGAVPRREIHVSGFDLRSVL